MSLFLCLSYISLVWYSQKWGVWEKKERKVDGGRGGGYPGVPIERVQTCTLHMVYLSGGFTQATFVLLEKMYLKLLFIAISNCVLKVSAAILIKAGGILAQVIVFLSSVSGDIA